MDNEEISQVLMEISELLELFEVNRFKVIAYSNASRSVSGMGGDLEDIYKKGGRKALSKIKGIGESIAEVIEDLIKTGKSKARDGLAKKVPKVEREMLSVPGIGPKTAVKLYKKLKVKDLSDLEKKAQKGGIRKLEGFDLVSEQNILNALKNLKKRAKTTRYLLTFTEPIARDVVSYLKKSKLVKKCDYVGSLRRMKETVGDIDLIVCSDKPEEIVEYFVKYPKTKKVIAKGTTKGSILHSDMIRIDLEVLPLQNYGSLLQHFTGSKQHNVHLRTWAKSKGFSISEYGIKKGGRLREFVDEKSFYGLLGMQYIEPELREDRGEIESALQNTLPKLVENNDIKGDLHIHSNVSDDAQNSILEMAQEAKELGYEYICFAEHTAGLGIVQGLTAQGLIKHKKRIEAESKKIKGIKLLSGCEVNIQADGKLDIPDAVLEKLDVVVASIHSSFKQSEEKITHRLLSAIKNPHVDIIGHPSGRLLLNQSAREQSRHINQRDPYDVEWNEVFKAAREHKTALEISAYPNRLDLRDDLIIEARKYGLKFSINTDAHSVYGLDYMRFGVSTARRGWLSKNEVINTFDLNELEMFLRKC